MGCSFVPSDVQEVCWSQDFPSLPGTRRGLNKSAPSAHGASSRKLLEGRSREEDRGHFSRNGKERFSAPLVCPLAHILTYEGHLHEPSPPLLLSDIPRDTWSS